MSLPPNPYKTGLLHNLYARLCQGPLRTSELRRYGGMSQSKRISQVRQYLEEHGYDLECRSLGKMDGYNQFEYTIVKRLPLFDAA